ncbi:hypothetical protein BDV28DRAFT_79662 [Aspergillus coremiiformis]|uniref:Uncharacterized protein n=1 Tax=Aspergillus coremiiformis TaxID=138285 RepID=A0A5N6ZA76_9EURO|nr:hypothetical protein BDV28DRAFT_79662 [Aspergillus coremiiformis]
MNPDSQLSPPKQTLTTSDRSRFSKSSIALKKQQELRGGRTPGLSNWASVKGAPEAPSHGVSAKSPNRSVGLPPVRCPETLNGRRILQSYIAIFDLSLWNMSLELYRRVHFHNSSLSSIRMAYLRCILCL